MDTLSTDSFDFLQLTTLLQQCLTFAADNTYQQRPLGPARLMTFGTQMQQLFVFNERSLLMPDQTGVVQAEQVSRLYPDTQSALIDLLYSCPQPADAEHWFDYQQEYQARTQQINNLTALFHWHQQLYQQLLGRFPRLQLPVVDPTPGQTACGSIDPKILPFVTAELPAADTGMRSGNCGLPALQL